ncbi:MAG: cation-translocating P-type ATPase [Betaproteobacteria bacterium]
MKNGSTTASEAQDPPTSTGLTEAEAQSRLAQHGPNELPTAKRRDALRIALEVVREPMLLLLVAGGTIYLAVGDLHEALILLVSVFVVMGITIYQERKTERALEALRDLSSPRALVIRDGEEKRIAGREVVPGDLVLLHEGDRVPADGVLVECNEFSADESLLTGESLPVSKRTAPSEVFEMANPGGDAQPFVFSGALVVQGYGKARILATGAQTQIGRIGKALESLDVQDTPLQIQTARLVRVFASIGLLLCLAVVVLYGMLRGDWLAGLLAGITLAMAVLPEEFPVVLTVFLALGAWRISQKKVLTRRMPAIETLGSATVLCVDKTGTLTENRMAVAELVGAGHHHEAARGALPANVRPVAHYAALACELNAFDPMERAIVTYAGEHDAETVRMRKQWRLVKEYDLTRELLAVTHCWQKADGGEIVVATKGAPETIATLCKADPALQARIMEQTAQIAARGRRVLGVAQARFNDSVFPDRPSGFSFEFLGLIALADPVRPTVPQALKECYEAGIRVVMITGDYPGTAQSIADEIGLKSPGGVLTGAQLESISGAELRRRVAEVSIFARVVPEQKLALVNALKANGEIVAMTGDGVNDAPALKAAHIGVAMGGRGTDVAREAASLVLLEDDFKSIVDTVRLGRRIYDNIRHAMAYLIAVHVPTAGMALLPLLFGWPLVFAPVHIVFLEFVIDPACSIAFEAEPAHPSTMRRPPRSPKEALLGGRLLWFSFLQGLAVLIAVAVLYFLVLGHGFAEERARAMAFTSLVLGNAVLIISNRSQTRSILATLRMPNRALWWIVGGAIGGLAVALYVPAMQRIFKFEALGVSDLLLCMLAASAGMAWSEIVKLMPGREKR